MNFLSFIQSYEGKENALPARKITEFTGLSDRQIRYEVERLRNEGQPVGSTKAKPVGYYWITTDQEMIEFQREYTSPFYDGINTSKNMLEGWYRKTGNQLSLV